MSAPAKFRTNAAIPMSVRPMCTQSHAPPSAGSSPGSARVVDAFTLNMRTTGRTKAPSTFTPVWRSTQRASSTTTQTATDTASGRLASGGRPSSRPRARSATVWRSHPPIVASEARRWIHSSRWTRYASDRPVAAT